MSKSNRSQQLQLFMQFIVAVLPYALFGIIYSSMKFFPNYEFAEVHTQSVYDAEKLLFGISTPAGILTPCEYFEANHFALMDILSGVFYLLWVPLPIAYTIWLFFKGKRTMAFRLSTSFLFVNLVGFAGYYIYPSCPPWYISQYGFDIVYNTPGNVAGFVHFDDILGIPLFHSIYAKNANVFAAIPSLHSAYNPIALYYAWKAREGKPWMTALAIVSVGIWFSAVYSSHHYVIDVLLGILTVIVGISLFEGVIMRTAPIRKSFSKINDFLNK